MHVSVVIPAYNEEKTIGTLIERVLEARHPSHQWEILVIDDGSDDKTAEIVQKFSPAVRLIKHETNQGKGASLQTAFSAVQGEVVIIQDADLEYHPKEFPSLLDPILQGAADVVVGSRFLGDRPHRVLYFWHSVGNRILTLFSNMTTNINLSDMEVGYKVIRTSILRQISIREKRFGVEPELIAKLALAHARFYEVGISYYGRTYEEGKKITWVDGLVAMVCIVRYGVIGRFFRR